MAGAMGGVGAKGAVGGAKGAIGGATGARGVGGTFISDTPA